MIILMLEMRISKFRALMTIVGMVIGAAMVALEPKGSRDAITMFVKIGAMASRVESHFPGVFCDHVPCHDVFVFVCGFCLPWSEV